MSVAGFRCAEQAALAIKEDQLSLLDFAKSAGAKIFGSSEHAAAPAEELKKEAEKHGLDMSKIKLHVDGDTVKVSGEANSTAEAEKIVTAVGNTAGVSKLENNLTAAKQTASSRFYTVQKGDTLTKIVEIQYGKGHGREFSKIFDANKPMLKDPDKIYPGQVLRIPLLV
jgi:nucleoid-associated protein YgaU